MKNLPFTSNENSFTLHIRITKSCNADCSYCSSFEKINQGTMSLHEYEKSLLFILEKLKFNKIISENIKKTLTIQYVGGEIGLVSNSYLESIYNLSNKIFQPYFSQIIQGCQTNLISSKEKIIFINNLFNKNIGTSFDHFTEQRTINKSSEKYKKIFLKNISFSKKQLGLNISGIIVLDNPMKSFIKEEIIIAEKNNRSVTIRPVFQGGSDINNLEISEIEKIYTDLFEDWFLKQKISIEPFYSLFQKRFVNYLSKKNENYNEKENYISNLSGCPFQHNCATSSLNLDPNGDLYICLDMADSKNFVLGNTLKNEFKQDIFNKILERSYHLNKSCINCDYFKECQGGCMNEAINHTNDVYGKTEFCSVWKKIFFLIDLKIEQNDTKLIKNWLNSLS